MHQPQPALAKRPQGPRGLGVPLFLLRSCASVEQKGVVGVRLAPTAGLLACGRTTHIAHTRTHRTHALLHSHSLTHPLTHRHRLIKHVAAAPRRRTGVAIVIAPCDDGLGSPSRPPRQESVPHRMSPLLYSVIFCPVLRPSKTKGDGRALNSRVPSLESRPSADRGGADRTRAMTRGSDPAATTAPGAAPSRARPATRARTRRRSHPWAAPWFPSSSTRASAS